MIKTVMFDMGGVIITVNDNDYVRQRFVDLGLEEVTKGMNAYAQVGLFGQLEEGLISEADYHAQLNEIGGREYTFEEIQYAWLGYMKEVPARNLQLLSQLKGQGYRVLLLSNTNPYIAEWTDRPDWDGNGHPMGFYFDKLYRSFEVGMMKPDERIFRHVLTEEKLLPEEVLFVDDSAHNVAVASQLGIRTFCPVNGEDWTKEIYEHLK